MARLPFDRYHAELLAETARFAAAVAGADPTLPVPTCPEWTLAQLVAHVGHGMRWSAVIVERRATGPVPNEQADDLEWLPRAEGLVVADATHFCQLESSATAARLADALVRFYEQHPLRRSC